MIERIALRVPQRLVRAAPFGWYVFAFLAAGSAFAAVVMGSLLWVMVTLGFSWLAAVAWHIADMRR